MRAKWRTKIPKMTKEKNGRIGKGNRRKIEKNMDKKGRKTKSAKQNKDGKYENESDE